jgi:hypothetical protein
MAFVRSPSCPAVRCLLFGIALGAAAAPLRAQYPAPAAGVVTLARPALHHVTGAARSAPRLELRSAQADGGRVLDRMATGALIGAGVGLVAAFVHTELTGDYSDHSLDGLAYLVAIPVGALAGLVVGYVVGVTGA